MKRIEENRVEIDLSEVIIFLIGKNIDSSKLKGIERDSGKVTFIFDEDIKKAKTIEELRFLDTPIEELDISVRTYNFLKSVGGITEVEDILLNSEKIRLDKTKELKTQKELRLLFKKNGFILYI